MPSLRTVDGAQYVQRTQTFDYDMIVGGFGESLSPGNEQRWFWGSAAADQPGSPNLIGIKNPAIDTLIEQVISAPDRDQLITRTHALDRVLLWNYYVIPHFYMGGRSPGLLGHLRRGQRSRRAIPSASTPGGSISRRSRT